MGPGFEQDAADLNTCEDNSTVGNPCGGIGAVVVNPPPGLPVMPSALYTADGGCWTAQRVCLATCP
jgi:hypothetical protein